MGFCTIDRVAGTRRPHSISAEDLRDIKVLRDLALDTRLNWDSDKPAPIDANGVSRQLDAINARLRSMRAKPVTF